VKKDTDWVINLGCAACVPIFSNPNVRFQVNQMGDFKSFISHFKRRVTMADFRRRQNSDRWHWSKDCSNYPTEKDVIITHTIPEYGSLCEECKEKEPLEEGE
jgi:hypothetical protein